MSSHSIDSCKLFKKKKKLKEKTNVSRLFNVKQNQMETTNGRRLGTVGRSGQLRQFAEDVRRRKRLWLALRSHVARTASRTAQLSGSRRCSRRLDGPLLPSSGRCSRTSKAAFLSALSRPATATGKRRRTYAFWTSRRCPSRFIWQSHLDLVAITQPSPLPSWIESSPEFRHVRIGRA